MNYESKWWPFYSQENLNTHHIILETHMYISCFLRSACSLYVMFRFQAYRFLGITRLHFVIIWSWFGFHIIWLESCGSSCCPPRNFLTWVMFCLYSTPSASRVKLFPHLAFTINGSDRNVGVILSRFCNCHTRTLSPGEISDSLPPRFMSLYLWISVANSKIVNVKVTHLRYFGSNLPSEHQLRYADSRNWMWCWSLHHLIRFQYLLPVLFLTLRNSHPFHKGSILPLNLPFSLWLKWSNRSLLNFILEHKFWKYINDKLRTIISGDR